MPSKKRLFILGAGGFGRELESWLQLMPEAKRDWQIAGYLDKNKQALDNFPSDYEIIGDEDSYQFGSGDLVALSIIEPKIKEAIYSKLKNKVRFFTYIAPGVVWGKHNQIGEGTIICPGCVISTNINLGKLVTINTSSQIGHDTSIADFCSIMANVDIGGGNKLGKRVFIGTNATIIPQREVSDDARIGSGSIVLRNIKEAKTVFGNPAKTI